MTTATSKPVSRIWQQIPLFSISMKLRMKLFILRAWWHFAGKTYLSYSSELLYKSVTHIKTSTASQVWQYTGKNDEWSSAHWSTTGKFYVCVTFALNILNRINQIITRFHLKLLHYRIARRPTTMMNTCRISLIMSEETKKKSNIALRLILMCFSNETSQVRQKTYLRKSQVATLELT